MEENIYMPTKEQVQFVIDNLLKMLPKAEKLDKKLNNSVEMMRGYIYSDCGTPMCHGGWYAVSRGIPTEYQDTSYRKGTTLMANDLGFTTQEGLENWALKNPEILGNKKGEFMFCCSRAFTKVNDKNLKLETIINHWKQVKENLPK